MSKNFYITTTLPYVNADPHIGFALEIVQADVIARYHQLLGEEVFFNTGTDEHGQKIHEAAQKEGISTQEYVDKYAAKFDALKKALNLSYNNFIRTTDKYHVKAAQEFWKLCDAKGDIYKKNYKIKYCVGCELEKQDSELVDGKCPVHPNLELETREEENYFFKWSNYQDQLLDFYKNNPDFVVPKKRFNEIKNFVKEGINDFSISRLKEKMPWGVEVPGDPDHVMYVWFDALINYISCLGWPKDNKKFEAFWPGLQVAGKDNLRQQSAMWQGMLMSAGLPPSKQILIHGFISSGGQKMSKSLGNVINPLELVEKYGTDAVRYYLLKQIHPFEDSDFTIENFEEVYNADLANGIGNLVSRVSNMVEKYFDEKVDPDKFELCENEHIVYKLVEEYKFNEALKQINNQVSETDQLIDKSKPWEMAKGNDKDIEELNALLWICIRKIVCIASQLKPFLPDAAEKIESIFKAEKIEKPKEPLFPRI